MNWQMIKTIKKYGILDNIVHIWNNSINYIETKI